MLQSLQQSSPNLLSPKAETATLQEVFSSIQGEGVYVGKRQLFVRFAHCHLHCAYCDTPMTTEDGRCHAELNPGTGEITRFDNPMTVDQLMAILHPLSQTARHHSVSVTGGEPLLYSGFLRALFPQIQALKTAEPRLKTYLETSGTQPERLRPLLPWTDIVAMDIKLPSTTQEAPQFQNHQAFLTCLAQHPETEVFIKLIVNQHTTLEEIATVVDLIHPQAYPVILQPETDLSAPPAVHIQPAHLLSLESFLAQSIPDVRVIPQTHKMIQVF